ncbi:HET-domain-containing protein [Annulohypoxylon truncatum]|uniref:HET-domain-containing protein n=1 Tax=Annulohypoxylon truncatum TaxID=327061 RepID=UPI00200873C6|nr:HET-domain-containing protein [Annulohypoxylon truncatum]KAI1207224.1 HET-domain-containing protein [Annulohypoxylon truncatum]
MPLTNCPVCGSRPNGPSSIWPEPESLTELPLGKWNVNIPDLQVEKLALDNCCAICATSALVLFAAGKKFGSIADSEARMGFFAHNVAPSQRYLLSIHLPDPILRVLAGSEEMCILFNPFMNSPLREMYEPCGELPVNSGSLETLGLAKRWLETCRIQHPECTAQGGHYVPTRLLDTNQGDIKLVFREEVEVSQGGIKYVALSYCWGGSQPLRTLKNNMSSHRVRMPFENLPATFKDAIKVVRSLGLRYIWIDSLCIVQDDQEDWVREAEQMERVYNNAELVLAAAVASSANDGFLRDRPRAKGGRINLRLNDTNAASQSDQEPDLEDKSDIRAEPDLIQCDYRVIFQDTHTGASKLPLDERAWAYQERLLARRYLIFGRDEIRWECLEDSYCECGWVFTDTSRIRQKMNLENMFLSASKCHTQTEGWCDNIEDYRNRILSASKYHAQTAVWCDIVEDYSKRELTVRSDKLVALSAIASRFQSKYGGTYLAGIWKEHLIHGLLWHLQNSYPSGPESPNSANSPEDFYIPSWSWASINVGDYYVSYGRINKVTSYGECSCAYIVNASVTPSTTNCFGPVSSGSIQLRAQVIQSTIRFYTNKNREPYIEPFDTNLEHSRLLLDLPLAAYDAALDHTSGEIIASARRINYAEKDSLRATLTTCSTWILPLTAKGKRLYYLALGPSPKQPGCFERLGMGWFWAKWENASKTADYISTKYKTDEITLV